MCQLTPPSLQAQIRAVYAAAEAALQTTATDFGGLRHADASELTATIRSMGIVRTRRRLLALPLLAAQAAGGDPAQAVQVAAAHHLYCLAAGILDAIQDGDLSRAAEGPGGREARVPGSRAAHPACAPSSRHLDRLDATQARCIASLSRCSDDEPTSVPLLLCTPAPLPLGLAVLFAAQHILACLSDHGVPPTRVVALQAECARTGYRMCAGQYGEWRAASDNWQVTSGGSSNSQFATPNSPTRDSPLATWYRIAAAKSGTFYALGARAGAWLGTDDPSILAAYSEYGHHLGLIVQAVNDLEGLLAQGHPDLVCGQFTLPVAYALAVAPPSTQDTLLDYLARARSDRRVAARAAELLVELGALHYTLLVVGQQRRQAATALARVSGDRVAHKGLLALLDGSLPDPS